MTVCKVQSAGATLSCACLVERPGLTGGVRCVEALALHRGVRVEGHEHGVAARDDRVWHFGAAELAEAARPDVVTVEDLHVIVRALLVRLQLEVIENLQRKEKIAKRFLARTY